MNIGVVGATGLVGINVLELLTIDELKTTKVCASNRSSGKKLKIKDVELTLEILSEDFFKELKFVFFCATTEIAKKWAPIATKEGCTVIDNSSEFRMSNPLIVPELNIKEAALGDIIANPNCSTIILCMVLGPLSKLAPFERIDVSTYQAVSGAGKAGLAELRDQVTSSVIGISSPKNKCFKSKIYNNCFSHDSDIGGSGYNGEELKMINETAKILDIDCDISATCIRIPVERAHCESVTIKFRKPVKESDIRKALESAENVIVEDNREENKFPEPLKVSGQHKIMVGRIRRDYHNDSGKVYHMFISGDQILKGASYNAWQIYKHFV
jgi:aspartate-semialdehyde dehydrogenase